MEYRYEKAHRSISTAEWREPLWPCTEHPETYREHTAEPRENLQRAKAPLRQRDVLDPLKSRLQTRLVPPPGVSRHVIVPHLASSTSYILLIAIPLIVYFLI